MSDDLDLIAEARTLVADYLVTEDYPYGWITLEEITDAAAPDLLLVRACWRLADALDRVREREAASEQARYLVGRLSEWDALNPPPEVMPAPFADMTYWCAEIKRVAAALAAAPGDKP